MPFSAIDWQKKIYLDGFSGTRPVIPTDYTTLEQSARVRLSKEAFAYVSGGAGQQSSVHANRTSFDSYKILPRMLRDVGLRDTSLKLFGAKIPSPLLLAPIGALELVHRDADLAVARAALKLGIPMILSNQASISMEECVKHMHQSPRWFQLYWSKSRELVSSFVHRAEFCGCEAVVVTLDTTMLGWRTMDLNLGYLPFLEGRGIAQYTSDAVFQKMLDDPEDLKAPRPRFSGTTLRGVIGMINRYPGNGFLNKLRSGRPMKAVSKFVATYSNPSTTWEDLRFLRSQTKLKIVLKGILHPDDASKAVDYGVDGIIVSNHGGRQIDGAAATMSALPAIIEAIQDRMPVLVDSGIRTGADIFKALALGAKAVCVGRPYVYGLAIAGQRGVEDVIRHLMAEFELTMALSGCKCISEIDSGFVKKE